NLAFLSWAFSFLQSEDLNSSQPFKCAKIHCDLNHKNIYLAC
ncbi:hypothetical protein D043_2890B, partial [Vibrio parahaemolyticus EKP-021]